jgi:hypothetical protein
MAKIVKGIKINYEYKIKFTCFIHCNFNVKLPMMKICPILQIKWFSSKSISYENIPFDAKKIMEKFGIGISAALKVKRI